LLVPTRSSNTFARFAAPRNVASWHQVTDCRESPIRSLSGAQQTCRELVGRVDPTLLTQLRDAPLKIVAAQIDLGTPFAGRNFLFDCLS
jgi:hypothetical protein